MARLTVQIVGASFFNKVYECHQTLWCLCSSHMISTSIGRMKLGRVWGYRVPALQVSQDQKRKIPYYRNSNIQSWTTVSRKSGHPLDFYRNTYPTEEQQAQNKEVPCSRKIFKKSIVSALVVISIIQNICGSLQW